MRVDSDEAGVCGRLSERLFRGWPIATVHDLSVGVLAWSHGPCVCMWVGGRVGFAGGKAGGGCVSGRQEML